ncbi:MAG: hypothetical protein SPJ27_04070 [Candidatus Onthovivens sp.]|nr:hypothetical protein [Candidatus Onthovivens sp.]
MTLSQKSRAVSTKLFSYSLLKNSFISALINKVFMTRFWSKAWENPLKMFVDSNITYGYTIEDLYVEAADAVDYSTHFENASSECDDIFKLVDNKVYANYLSINFEKKFKTSIKDFDLRRAFTSEYGLGDMIGQLMTKNIRGLYRLEYNLLKDMLTKYLKGLSQKDVGMGSSSTPTQFIQDSQVTKVTGVTTKELIENLLLNIRIYGEQFEFESDKYNSAKVMQFSPMSDTVIVTTPQVYGHIDNYLAKTYNEDRVKILNKIILIDSLPDVNVIKSGDNGGTSYTSDKPIALLMDSKLLQLKPSLLEMREIENPNALAKNYFLHFHGLVGIVPFLNCKVFTATESQLPKLEG